MNSTNSMKELRGRPTTFRNDDDDHSEEEEEGVDSPDRPRSMSVVDLGDAATQLDVGISSLVESLQTQFVSLDADSISISIS